MFFIYHFSFIISSLIAEHNDLGNQGEDIAETKFHIYSDHKLKIICDDAFEFVKTNQQLFDLIIIDLFIDNLVPENFYSTAFWERISGMVRTSGYFIFNASVNNTAGDLLSPMTAVTEKSFIVQRHEQVEQTNTLITGQKR